MRSEHVRLIGLATASAALIVVSVFVMDWFVVKVSSEMIAVSRIGVDLRTVHACIAGGACGTFPVSGGGGAYPAFATITFWGAICLGAVVAAQAAYRVHNGVAFEPFAKLGYGLAAVVAVTGFTAGYLVNPGLGQQDGGLGMALSVTRTVAPLLLLAACVAAVVVQYLAATERAMVAAPHESLPAARARYARPAVAAPAEVPMATVEPPAEAASMPAPPAALAGVLRFATRSAELSLAGLDAWRETGEPVLVPWNTVVGAVARRLPAESPYASQPFVDVVSTAGATLRILPWTRLSGEPLDATDDVARCRAVIRLVMARCPDAHLDGATREFVAGGPLLQLPDAAMLAGHDARLA